MSKRLEHPVVLAAITGAVAIALCAMMWDLSPDIPPAAAKPDGPRVRAEPPRLLPIVAIPVATRLAKAYDEYGTFERPQLRTAFIALGREHPIEAMGLLSDRLLTETRPHLMQDFAELAIRTGGQAALAVITAYGDRSDLDFACRTATIEAIARARLTDAVMLLVDWQERPIYAQHSALLRDAAVSLGTAADAAALGERARARSRRHDRPGCLRSSAQSRTSCASTS